MELCLGRCSLRSATGKVVLVREREVSICEECLESARILLRHLPA